MTMKSFGAKNDSDSQTDSGSMFEGLTLNAQRVTPDKSSNNK
jgi:hypothetical protein